MSEEQKYVKTKDGTIIVFQAPIFHSKMRHIANIVSAGFICFSGGAVPQCKCYGRSESLNLESDPKDTEIANKQLFGIYRDRAKEFSEASEELQLKRLNVKPFVCSSDEIEVNNLTQPNG